jgi:acetolactate synthase-1/2/3 large subunit
MIKVSDYIANFLAASGIRHVFMLTGGGAMHLNNSLGKHPELRVIFNHHEQAGAIAAESYARLSNQIAVLNVTTGPGGLNTLNGVFGAWTDSIPMLVISGQVRYDTTVQSTGLKLRQFGDQECDIVSIVKLITKYAEMVIDPLQIHYQLQKALYIATHGRPGPVWIDIPMNVQGSTVDETQFLEFDPGSLTAKIPVTTQQQMNAVLAKICAAERPVILTGAGVRLSGAHEDFLTLLEKLQIPVVTAWNAHDSVTDDHPLYIGRPNSVGDRAGNFAVQNADLLLVLGSRLNIRQIGYNWKSFARAAYKIVVDIDPVELLKPSVAIDLAIHADLADFIPRLLNAAGKENLPSKTEWLDWCRTRRARYPVVLPEYWNLQELVNPYCFMEKLNDALPENQIIVVGDGTASVVSSQAVRIKKGMRFYSNSGCASMGYDLPAAIGACIAAGGAPVVCLAGDGSIQLNIQELATVMHNQYPLKIFIFNNNGYHSIRQTQKSYFGEPYVGIGPESGLGFPDFAKIAFAYNIPFVRCERHAQLEETINATLNSPGPAICEVMLTLEQAFAPKLSSRRLSDGRMVSRPLEDMAPFLSREELAENMLIEILSDEQV